MNEQSRQMPKSEFMSTLERGLRVLRSFDQENPEMQLSEVATKTNLSPAVARRCLNTLVQLGYVAQYGRKFLLRPEVLIFGQAFTSSMNLERIVTPFLQTVRDETGDSSSLSVLSDQDILYLVHVSTKRHIRLGANVGTRFPAFCTSLGRILLANLPPQDLRAFMETAKFQKHTEHTITERCELQSMLIDIKRSGYAATQDELDYGILSVAVPLFGPEGQVVAAINCSTTTSRTDKKTLVKERVPLLQNAAKLIEAELHRFPFLSHSLQS